MMICTLHMMFFNDDDDADGGCVDTDVQGILASGPWDEPSWQNTGSGILSLSHLKTFTD